MQFELVVFAHLLFMIIVEYNLRYDSTQQCICMYERLFIIIGYFKSAHTYENVGHARHTVHAVANLCDMRFVRARAFDSKSRRTLLCSVVRALFDILDVCLCVYIYSTICSSAVTEERVQTQFINFRAHLMQF